MSTPKTEVQIYTTQNAQEDRMHGIYSRAWERLQKIVRKHGLQVNNEPYKYSTFGNGFHLYNDRKWVTATSSTQWVNYGKENEEMYFVGRITFYRRAEKTTCR